MNRLSRERRTAALEILAEGLGVRAASRITGTQKNTIFKLVVDVGAIAGNRSVLWRAGLERG